MSGKRETAAWRRYLRFWGSDYRADIEDELSFHLEARVAELMRRGASEAEARERAVRAFGDVDTVREELRQMDAMHERRVRQSVWSRDVVQDVRMGYRLLARRRAYAATVIATLALGIAASVAIYSLVYGILLRPLPYPAGEDLVVVWERNIPRARAENVVSVPNFEAWRERARSFVDLAALMPSRLTVAGEQPEQLYGGEVTPSWFTVVGVQPAYGRGFTDADAQRGDVIVLSHDLWVSRYGGDAGVVGRTIELSGRPHEVLGVMPDDFVSPTFGWLDHQQYWVPFLPTPDNRTWGRFLLVLGRLAPGTPVEAAQREMIAIATEQQSVPGNAEWTSDVVTLHEQVTQDVRTALVVLLIAVVLLQLIALVNVMNLVLARIQERDQEFGVRAALGAGRLRLLRQLLAEAFALVSIGAPLGVLFGAWATKALIPLLPAELPRIEAIRIDGNVLAFAAAAALVSFLVLGLVPVLRLVRSGLTAASARSGARIATSRANSAIIVAEIALALMLTATAGLTMRSFIHLRSLDLGFVPDDVVTMRLALPASYDTEEKRALYFEEVLDNLRALPGVTSAAAASNRPFNGGAPATTVMVQGTTPEVPPVAEVRVITPDYFTTLRTPLLEGRVLGDADRADAPRAYVISASLARMMFPDRSPIGQRLVVNLNNGLEGEVVGVIDDVRQGGPSVETLPAVYMPHAQWSRESMDIVVRSSLPFERQADPIRSAIRTVDRTIVIQQLETMSAIAARVLAQDRVNMLILLQFALVALLLAATGIYGVLAIEVGRRSRELGIRMAIGAHPGQVRLMVLRRALLTALVGVGLGTALAVAATRGMQAMLHGVSASDPRTFVGVAVLMVLIALGAAYVPARRATRVDPVGALRG